MSKLNQTATLWNMIVEPVKAEETTKGGIVLPNQVREANDYLCAVGQVLSMGPLCFKGDKFADLPEAPVKEGDFITFNAHAGIVVKERDQETGQERRLKILHDDNVLTKVEDPARVVGYV